MSEQESGGPILERALCRCCRTTKKCRLLTAEYTLMGQPEIYKDMIVDCFGLLLSHAHHNESNSGVCFTCVCRLRDAVAFRQQIIQCEELLSSAHLENDPSATLPKIEMVYELKPEPRDSTSLDDCHNGGDEEKYFKKNIKTEPKWEPGDVSSDHHHCIAGDGWAAADHDDDEGHKQSKTKLEPTKQKKTESAKHQMPKSAKHQTPKSAKRKNTALSNPTKRFPCDQCDRICSTPSMLTQHMIIHTGIRPFACHQCHKRFAQKNTLREHILGHRAVKPFLCEQCGKSFVRKSFLAQHVATVHNGSKPFTCQQCHKSFIQRCNLNKHMLIHIGTRPFACDQCFKCFGQRSTLTRHMLRHTENGKIFPCTHCDKRFSRKDNLATHIRLHNSRDKLIPDDNTHKDPKKVCVKTEDTSEK